MTKKAAIYVRVSSERQAGPDRVSVTLQMGDCEAYCQERGYIIAARYIDAQKYKTRGQLVQPSGARKDRPGYRALLKAARAGEFDVIIAWKEDRLYRGLYAALPLAELLDELGSRLTVELVKETFDVKMLGIKAALGKLELDNIRERMVAARRVHLERGEVPGGDQVRYGYRKIDRRLEIDPEEAKVIHMVFEWYLAGVTLKQMQRRLDTLEIKPRRAKQWSKSSIQRILTNECYATGKLETKLDGETYLIPCPTIIDRETWKRARETSERNKARPGNLKEDYLLQGLVVCACGWKMGAKTDRSNYNRGLTKKTGGRYMCPRYGQQQTIPDYCVPTVGSLGVDNQVWIFVKEVCQNPELLQAAIEAKLKHLEGETEAQAADVAAIEKRLAELAEERARVITLFRRKIITEADLERQINEIDFAQTHYEKALSEAAAAAAAVNQVEAVTAWLNNYLADLSAGLEILDIDPEKLPPAQFDQVYKELDAGQWATKFPEDRAAQLRWALLEERRRLVRALIDRVIITRDGRKRIVTPVLALDIPLGEGGSYAHGDQSASYQPQAGEYGRLATT